MATFAIYTFKFRDIDNKGLFVGQTEKYEPLPTLEDKQRFMQQIFIKDHTGKEPFLRGADGCDCKTLWESSGFIVLMVSNIKNVTRHQKFRKIKDHDEPWCHVLIDNRPGREFIAIEKNGAFSSPDIVANILQDELRYRFALHHVEITIKNQYQPDAFWDIINKHLVNGIRQVAFHFSVPNPPWASELLGNMNEAARSMHARPTAIFSSPDNSPLIVDPQNEELRRYVEVCAKEGEDITVKVAGIRARLHVIDVKDKYVYMVMEENAFKEIVSNSPELFDKEVSLMAGFFDPILKAAE